ncbi:MAG: TRAP transporter substrate-binding protein DctP [Thermoanaerobaculia bacterium]
MKRFAVLVGLLLLTLGLATRGVEAATVIKLATLVPDGSVWDKALKEMGADWKESSDGRVTLRIYPGGVAGDEPDVVRKMRIGQIQAASLTVTGLSEIDPAFKVFTIPLFYDSYEELLFVLEAMEPYLAAKLEARGFVFVHWGHAGWVHLFSKDPIRQIDDLKQQKLFVWAGQDDMVQWWMRSGFKPVALAATDIMTGLQTGMIEVLPTTPLAALNLQWFRQTPYMHELGLAPLVGATVVTEKAWKKISAADQKALLAAARRTEEQLEKGIPQQDREAVEAMTKRGLEVVAVTDETEWREAAAEFADTMREAIVPAEAFDRALAERNRFRSDRADKVSP